MAGPLTDFAWLRPATDSNHTRQEAHKHQAPVAPQTLGLSSRDACSHHTESNALPTEQWDRQYAKGCTTLVVLCAVPLCQAQDFIGNYYIEISP